mmetsp:Transcript_32181/g.55008  ORF Transcript_32181/g.55008 Transcript_32181/m.55008 type:complete len:363 (+) Transcript_32181:90-1178(+)
MSGIDAADGMISDPSETSADHIPVKKLTIGSWNLAAKYDETILLSFYWAERKLVWEVLHLGVVRKMEVDFEDVEQTSLASGGEEHDRFVIELQRPPRFFKETPSSAGGEEVNYVYTTDFTSGQASTESRHVLLFEPGAISRDHAKLMSQHGIRLVMEGERSRGGGLVTASSRLERGLGGPIHATSAALRQPPTSTPRLDAIILKDTLSREMRERQARYTGICPVRERIYAKVFDELIASISRNAGKRAGLLRRVGAEARMTIDAYRTVFESSIEFGSRKLQQAVQTKGDLEGQIAALDVEISALKAKVLDMQNLCESLEHRAEQKAKVYEVKDKEEVDLATEKQQLEDLLAVLRLSKPEKPK